MLKLVNFVTCCNSMLGKMTAWLCLAVVLLQVAIVLNRYCFGYSSMLGQDMIVYEEALLYGFSAIFLLGAAYTYILDAHVRVDVFYAPLGKSHKSIIDGAGNIIFLLPLAILIVVKSNLNLDLAWSTSESSMDGGLPYVYLWMTMLPAFALTVALQGIANSIALAISNSSRPIVIEKLLAAVVAVFSIGAVMVTLDWALDPSWSNPDPWLKAHLYAAGVVLARIGSVSLFLWCTAVVFDLPFTRSAPSEGKLDDA